MADRVAVPRVSGDAELILEAISLSGLTPRQFALRVLSRDDRTIRAWRTGQPIPPAAREWLARFVALPTHEQDALVAILTR